MNDLIKKRNAKIDNLVSDLDDIITSIENAETFFGADKEAKENYANAIISIKSAMSSLEDVKKSN